MSTSDKRHPSGKWEQIKSELSVSEMSALSDYQASGVDCTIVIGDEIQSTDILCHTDVQPDLFTTFGKLTPGRLAKFLETAKEKYEVQVKVFCSRRVR